MSSLERIMYKESKKKEKTNPMKTSRGIKLFPSLKKDEMHKAIPKPEKMPENEVLDELNEIKKMLRELTEAVADLKFTIIRRYMQRIYAEKTLEKRRVSDRVRQKRHKLKRK